MDGEHWIRKAFEAILNHDFEQAVEWFERAIALEPDNAGYRYKLSITYARSNKLAKAIEQAEEACRLEPGQQPYRYHLHTLQAKACTHQAEAYFSGDPGQLHMAAALLEQAVRLDPLAVEAYLMLGVAYTQLEEYGKAIAALKEAIRLDPQHEAARKQLEAARALLRAYLKREPNQ